MNAAQEIPEQTPEETQEFLQQTNVPETPPKVEEAPVKVTLVERVKAWFGGVMGSAAKVRNLFIVPNPMGTAITGYGLLLVGAFLGGTAVFLMLDSQHDSFRRQSYAQHQMVVEQLVVREAQLKGVSSELVYTKERMKFWQDRFDILTTNFHALAYPQGTASNLVTAVVSTNRLHWWNFR